MPGRGLLCCSSGSVLCHARLWCLPTRRPKRSLLARIPTPRRLLCLRLRPQQAPAPLKYTPLSLQRAEQLACVPPAPPHLYTPLTCNMCTDCCVLQGESSCLPGSPSARAARSHLAGAAALWFIRPQAQLPTAYSWWCASDGGAPGAHGSAAPGHSIANFCHRWPPTGIPRTAGAILPLLFPSRLPWPPGGVEQYGKG